MRRKLVIFQVILALLLIVTGSTSFAQRAATIRGTLQSDKVELSANLSSEDKEIFPGDKAKQQLIISNLGTDCYLRVTPKIKETDVPGLEFDCTGDWMLKNGVYYYTKVFKKDKSLSFCENVSLPKEMASGELQISYGIDAIQSDNFMPDFNSLNPWGNVEIIEVKNRGKSISLSTAENKGSNTDSLEIHYNEDAKSLISNFDEIFKDMPLMEPGDSYTEEILLKNSGKEAKTLYLSDVTDGLGILKYIDISIIATVKGEKKEIFSGTLGSEDKTKKLNAGTLLPGEETSLLISANMAKDANNDASSLSTHLSIETWAEDTVGDKEEIGDILEKEIKDDNKKLEVRSAKTGDDFEFWKLMILAGIMLMAGAFFVKKRE